MKRYIFVFTVLLASFLCGRLEAQVGIPGTSVTFKLNNDEWRYLKTFTLEDGGDVYLYYYIGRDVIDHEGDTVLPYLRVYVNENYKSDIYSLAYERYMQQPFQSLDEYTHGAGLPKNGGIGYRGAYTSPSNQKDYQFYMTYFKDGNTAVEFRLETTKDTFGDMEPVFKNILSTIK